jgi:hypothetical protein
MAWVNATPEQKLLGDGLEFVTGVTVDWAIYRDGKTERLKLFLHCCYSVSRGRRAIGIHHNWNFRSTCKKSGGITIEIMAVPPNCIPLHWSRAPFPAPN